MLVLIRHGESVANAQGVLSGWRNVPLTSKGRQQARAVGHLLPDIECRSVWCSDLDRAETTAKLALDIWSAQSNQSPPLYKRAALRERRMGVLQGQKKAQLRKFDRLKILKTWNQAPNLGESFLQLSQRVFSCLVNIPSSSFIFAHGGVIRMIAGVSKGAPPSEWMYWNIPNAKPITIEIPSDGWLRQLENNI